MPGGVPSEDGVTKLLPLTRPKAAKKAGCYNSSPRETMSNLAKAVIQLHRERITRRRESNSWIER